MLVDCNLIVLECVVCNCALAVIWPQLIVQPLIALCIPSSDACREKAMPDVFGTLDKILADREYLEEGKFGVADVAVG